MFFWPCALDSSIWAEWTAFARSLRIRAWGMWSTWSLTTRGRKRRACTPCWQRSCRTTSVCTNRTTHCLMCGRRLEETKMTFSFMTGLLPAGLSPLFMFCPFPFPLTMLFHSFVNRCGRLTHRISLPYSIIGHGHVERAVKDTYCNSLCGECTHEVRTAGNYTHSDKHAALSNMQVFSH